MGTDLLPVIYFSLAVGVKLFVICLGVLTNDLRTLRFLNEDILRTCVSFWGLMLVMRVFYSFAIVFVQAQFNMSYMEKRYRNESIIIYHQRRCFCCCMRACMCVRVRVSVCLSVSVLSV